MAEDKRYDLKVTGRAARPRSKRLRDAGMSVQPGSTVVVGGVEGLEGKLDKYIFDDLFEKVEIREGVYAIRAKYGLFTNEFLSAKGIDEGDEGGTGGASYLGQLVNVGEWADQTPAYDRIMVQLAGSTHWTEKRLDEIGGGLDEEQLAAYLTENNYAKTGDIPSLDGYATEAWVTGRGYITSAALNGYATQSWVVGKGYATTSDLDARIDALVNGAPAAFDTLKEIADVLQGNVDSIDDILTTIGTKADKSISISAGTGLTGGGTLSANRTLSLKPATTSALGGIIVGDRLSIDSSGRLTATYTYTHPSATATTITAATGKVLSAITVNSLGHVTSVAAKTLAAADIPSLTISKITGLQDELDKKLDKSVLDDLFEKVEIREGVYAIRAKYGLFTNEFLSAKGIDEGDEGGTGGASYLGQLVNVGEWADQTPAYDRIMVQLAGSTHWTEKRLDEIGGGLDEEQLAAYLTENNYAKTGDIPSLDGYATEAWVTGRGYITSAALNGYATQSWVVGKGYATTSDLDARIDALVNGAPAAFDTLKEIADVLQGNVDSIDDILTTIGTKADKSISISAGTGLTGGGTLSANRTLSLKPATTSALGGIIVGDRLSIDSSGRLTATYTYTHPSATATTITAATGKVLSAITVNSLGHVTSVAAKTLAAADIPSLTISKITGLQDELDKKLDKSVLDDLFEKVEIREGVYAIRAKYGLFTNEFLSAKGMDEGSESPGGGATKLSELTDVSLTNLKNNDLLRWNGTRWVNVPQSSISPSLAWENITGKPSTFPPSAHTHTKSQITDFPATWAWGSISGKPTTLSGYGITDGVNDVTVSGSGNAVTGASISGHKLTLTKGSTFLLSSAYTANDILTKLKTVDGAGSGLDADTLDGYHGSSDATGSTYVLRTSTGGIITKGVEYKSNYYATPKSAGWYRFFKFASSNANGASAIIHIDRLYYSPSNESYTFAINVSFGTGISITQLSGFANSRLITKIRVNYVNSGDMYVDFYYDSTSYFSNIVYCYGSGRGNFQTPELVSTSTGSNYEFKTGNGFVCNEGINGVDMSRIFYGKGNKPSGLMSSVTGSGCYSTTGSLPDDAPDGAYGYGNFVIFDAEGSSANGGAITQIYFPHRNESPYYRTTYGRNTGMYIGWYKLARTTDNVASASKLETAHTINGTSFDGSANITTSNWGTARSVGIVNSDGTGTAVTVSVNGGANVNLKLPATIKAALTGNATTATTLQTARTIWGQSFNGSKNVSGAISGATTINASGAVTFGSTLAVTGAVTLKSALSVSGLITATAGLTTPQYLQVGNGRIYWDATNKALYVKGSDGTAIGFYSNGWMSAKGAGSETGGTGGGGISGEIDTLTFSRGVNDRQMVLTNGCSIRWLTAKGSWAGSVTVYNNAGNTSLWSVSGAYGGQDSIIYSYYGGTSYSSPAMVITKAMNVGIGTTSPTSKLHVNGNITANNVSDIRLKTIVKEEANYCHKLLSLGRIVDFYYNDKAIQRNTGAVDRERHTGLIYQSAKEIGLPNFCHTDDDGYGAINYLCTDYINLIAGALQQTILRQETIEQRVERLERENEELRRQLNNLTAA